MKKDIGFSLKIAIIYLIISFIWIIFSDKVLFMINFDTKQLTHAQNYKGSFFVFFTSVLLFFMILKKFRELEKIKDKLKYAENRYRRLFNNMKNGIFIIKISEDDKDFIITELNENFSKIEKKDYYWIIGKKIEEVFLEKKDVIERILKTHITNQSIKYTYRIEIDGRTEKSIEYEFYKISDKEIVGIVLEDSENEKNRQLLKDNEEKYRILVESNLDGICLQDLRGNIVECNDSGAKIFNYTKEEILNKNIRDLVPDEFRKYIPEIINEEMATGERYVERLNKKKDGTLFVSEVNTKLIKIAGEKYHLVYIRDISEKKEREKTLKEQKNRTEELNIKLVQEKELLKELTITDALTGIYNRTYLYDIFLEEIKKAQRYILELSFLLVDIDNFKSVNERFGHNAGDTVLKRLSYVIKGELRDSDILGRFGGKEFLILMPLTNIEKSKNLAERIRKKIEALEWAIAINITVSIGIVEYNGEKENELIKKLENVVFKAKCSGKNKVSI